MFRRAVPLLAAAAFVSLAAGCGVEPAADPASDDATSSPTPTVVEQPSPTPAEAADDGDEENTDDAEDRSVATGECAAYANSGSWCTDGIGDYDCEGGTGNGPNYAPRGVTVIEPGVDPFGLDGNDNDGEGCEITPPAAPAPPANPGTDPRFDTCAEAIDNGYGPYRQGEDPEYDWYRDSDSDGVVC